MRELLRDFGNDRLDIDTTLTIADSLRDNQHFIADYHRSGFSFLLSWCAGYSAAEIAASYGESLETVRSSLRFSFELLGRRLQVHDGIVLHRIPPQLHPVAKSIFRAYYETFTELREHSTKEEELL